jgi:regulation of enolase protein 1 (concanavalin A-like superfamily)
MMVQNVVLPRLIVEVFEHPYFGGKRGIVWQPVRYTGNIGFQRNISSIRVFKGPNFARNADFKALFYEHIDFQGKRLALGPGFYPNIHDIAYDFGDRITSINFGPALDAPGPDWGTIPLIVEVYRDVDFKGTKCTVLRDIDHTGKLGIHDQISSVRIIKGPDCPPTGSRVIFFEHVNFEGARLPIEILPRDVIKEIPNLHALPQSFGDMISSIKIEGWSSSSEFNKTVFEDEFYLDKMKPEWRWIDPKGGGSWAPRQGYLEMRADRGQDLWHGADGRSGNMDAPRLLMQVEGDFATETRIRVDPQLREHGGLLVWKGPEAFLRLEKTSGAHAFKGDVRFEKHVNRVLTLVGRASGLRQLTEIYLRIERRGNQFSAFASTNGSNWVSCGQTYVGIGDPLLVGLHTLCPGNIPPTLTRFDYFRLQKRQSEAATYKPVILLRPEDEVTALDKERAAALKQIV